MYLCISKMRVLIVNTSERTGGAAVAAQRLMIALNNNGVKAKMLVRDKETESPAVVALGRHMLEEWHFLAERLVIWFNNLFSRKNLFKVSIANTGTDITRLPEFKEADIIHLHWINQGFLSLQSIRKILQSGKPVVWTMHDMWEATAICHHAYTCEQYQTECHHCPFLRFPARHDLSNRVFRKKQKLLAGADIHFVAVSQWLAERAKKSALIGNQSVTVIPNAISTSQFSMTDRQDARSMLALGNEHYYIVFGAARVDDDIKGLDYLTAALNKLTGDGRYDRQNIRLVLFGGIKDERVLANMPVPTSYMGYVNDHVLLSQLYSAADVVVSSSLYETFGQTIIEAQLCGCTPVAFGNSGQADIIEHQVNGYLADYLSADSLADGIDWAFHARLQPQDLKKRVIRKYAESVVANKYIHLYQQLVKESL